jgi:hypothetical protein
MFELLKRVHCIVGIQARPLLNFLLKESSRQPSPRSASMKFDERIGFT